MTRGAVAAWMLLSSVLPAPLWAQSDGSPGSEDPAPAVVRPAPRHPVVWKQGLSSDDRNSVTAKTSSAEDPESQPLSFLQGSRPADPVADTGSLALDVLGKLGLVVALMIACAAVWKRFRGVAPAIGAPAGQTLQVTSTVALGPQRFLHLVTAGQHQLLVGSSPQNVSLIAVLEGGASEAAGGPDPRLSEAARGTAPEPVGQPGSSVVAPIDRFEEVMRRTRELETGMAPTEGMCGRSAPLSGAQTAAPAPEPPSYASREGVGWSGEPRSVRGGRASTSPHSGAGYVPVGPEEGEGEARSGMSRLAAGSPDLHARAGWEDEADRPLAPGALFRTARAPVTARSGPDD